MPRPYRVSPPLGLDGFDGQESLWQELGRNRVRIPAGPLVAGCSRSHFRPHPKVLACGRLRSLLRSRSAATRSPVDMRAGLEGGFCYNLLMREATRQDLPKGSEAQCVTCWRIFRSDRQAERHKSYSKPKSKDCKDPVSLGMIAVERRGLAVWGAEPREMPEIGPREELGGTYDA